MGIGASAGGLDACRKLLAALPAKNGMAFILVQHLDPNHKSMMVDLLGGRTAMPVRQAVNGMPLEPDNFYVIPPGTYLAVADGALRLSPPPVRPGQRLPFDFLLQSMAEDCGRRAVAVILSGSGADGSLGLQIIKKKGGFVIAQAPEEAGYDGMPRNAIDTGAVDAVLEIARIPAALDEYRGKLVAMGPRTSGDAEAAAEASLTAIIELIRAGTPHDFRLYRQGTLRRRIERRMTMASIEGADIGRYLHLLRTDPNELGLLAKDLLINVTSFFRDNKAFDLLESEIVPDIVRRHKADQPLRIWIAGCSTGEETYSIAMLFREAITAAKSNIKLQVFASDVDPDAIAQAREGVYPRAIEAEVSAERLARFFTLEDQSYRILPDLRSAVVFTVQDLLADPPFSRIDLISCRNLLIYIRPEAQAKVISLFHFALREGGLLLLGSSETIANLDGRFEVISKAERLYRRIGRSRPGELSFLVSSGDGIRAPISPKPNRPPSRQAGLAELCRELVVESYAPAALLINRANECLYSVGPTDRYLRVAPGHPTHDLLSMARQGMRTKLRAAIQNAVQQKAQVSVAGGRTIHEGVQVSFRIDVRPVLSDGEELLLICFVDELKREQESSRPVSPQDASLTLDLERELASTRSELQSAIRNLEIAGEEQKAINEEALSVNEEFQSTNEELLTSKEELQSLNEELNVVNSQLQETLERQRTTSNDLQNVLYSTDIATLFLDAELNIRLFTPTMNSFFRIIHSDIGRPLADLKSLTPDNALYADSRTVLQTLVPMEQEVETPDGRCFSRRVLPYRTHDNSVGGVVITFTDITESKRTARALEAAKQHADMANVAKSRFLAAASHDLRQPLQTLVLIQGLLAKTVETEAARKLVAMVEPTLAAMNGMLNALLDINQIDAGTIQAEITTFRVGELLDRLRDEFTYHAQAHGLELRVVRSNLPVRSDPVLLEQILRNLLANAIKYTRRGRILLGCRRRAGRLAIEVWDTGIGIPHEELQPIFEEFHQVDNAPRARERGLGLGLSIVQRLADLLGHRIGVRSEPGRGSVFSIDVARPPAGERSAPQSLIADPDLAVVPSPRTGTVLLVEDDIDVRELLQMFLEHEGHHVIAAPDGVAALTLLATRGIQPDLILADFNLPNGMNGLEIAAALLDKLHRRIPVIILTGDISTETLRGIAAQDCLRLAKPIKMSQLSEVIQRLLETPVLPPLGVSKTTPLVYVVDDDRHVRGAVRSVLEDDGFSVEDYATCEAFLEAYRPRADACLLIDAYLPGMSGLELLQRLQDDGHLLPAVMITGKSDVMIAVQAMKAGASDFIEKPIGRVELLACVERALGESQDEAQLSAAHDAAALLIADLTDRQRQIMDLVLAGQPSKNIAADLNISQRTVENHRALVMKKTGAKSIPALARLAIIASKRA